MERGRRIAFDYGDVRIGVAVSDPDAILISPLAVLNTKDKKLFQRIKDIFEEFNPVTIFVGLPVSMSGIESESSEKARMFAQQLEDLSSCRVVLVDERLSTVNAQTKARAAGKSTRDTKNSIDALAAVEILERGLSHERAQ
jgi:putative Holliday junction resolvase